ncbi:MAG TPA: sugar ABC transporter substrate-binding protein [Firmicutes bacterium]|nr:sugar ABC transporter substrate-binding protein [Bacillota bacterium]
MKRLVRISAIVAGLAVLWLFVLGMNAQAVTTIKFTYWGSPEYDAAIRSLIKTFEEENPDIKVEPILIPSKYYDKLQTMIAGGDAPDVAMLAFDRVPQFVSAGALQPIDQYVAKTGYPLKDLFPAVLNTFTYEGKLYGLPRSFSPFVLFYNVDLFKQAGIARSDNWKWADFREAAIKLTPMPGRPPFGFAAHYEADGRLFPEWFFPFIWQNGGDVIDPKTLRSRLLEPATKEAIAFYVNLIHKDKVAPTSVQGQTYGGSPAMFLNRRAAMIIDAYNMVLSARTQEELKFDVMRLPYQKERATVVFPIGYVIPKLARHPEEAFTFLAFLGGPKGQSIVPQLGLGMPGLRSIAESDLFLQPGKQPEHSRVFLLETEVARPLPATLPKFQEWYAAWRQQLEPVLAGTESLDTALVRADQEINRILASK